MPSYTLAIADAVVAQLNSAEFSLPFVAVRSLLPEYSIAELAELRVTVVPPRVEITRETRASQQFDVDLSIGVQKAVADIAPATIEPLLALAEEIAAHFDAGALGETDARWLRTIHDPLYIPEHLAEHRVFTSMIIVTYRRWN